MNDKNRDYHIIFVTIPVFDFCLDSIFPFCLSSSVLFDFPHYQSKKMGLVQAYLPSLSTTVIRI